MVDDSIMQGDYLTFLERLEKAAMGILENSPSIDFDQFFKEIYHDAHFKQRYNNYEFEKINLKKKMVEIINLFSNQKDLEKDLCFSLINSIEHFDDTVIENKLNVPGNLKISIVGGGLAGLLIAKSLDKFNYGITIYEKRSKQESLSRFFVIVIRDGNLLEKIIGKEAMDFILKHGGTFDECTHSLRASISIVQQAVIFSLSTRVEFRYEHEVKSVSEIDKSSICILAFGAQTVKKFNLNNMFKLMELEKYRSKVREMMCIQPFDAPKFYWRHFIPGKKWIVVSNTVDSSKDLYENLKNVVGSSTIIDGLTKSLLLELKNSLRFNCISLTKIKSAVDVDLSDTEPFYHKIYDIVPSIALNQITYSSDGMPIVLLGDATGNVHPITISGAEKYLKVIPFLINFVTAYNFLRKFEGLDPINNKNNLFSDLLDLFEYSSRPIIEEVCFKTVAFCLYTELERMG